MSVPAYPEYNDSVVPWLGEVPAHWPVTRLKNSVADCRNGIWGDEPQGDENDIICVRVADFIRETALVDLTSPTYRNVREQDRASRIVRPGDLLLEKSGGGEKQLVGAVVQYTHAEPAICSNFVARIQLAPNMSSSFWAYVHSAAYAVRLNYRSVKQTSGIQNLDQTQYLDELAAFPPIEEQHAIAAFLDRETAKIDALVAEQERLIALLKEKRQAVISHAVTKGLNPDAPMKDSGIEWLGEIPAHWDAVPIKHLVTFRSGGTPSKDNLDFWNGEIPWASAKDLKADILTDTIDHITQLAVDERAATLVPAGAVAVLVRGMMLARLFPVCELGVPMTINQDLKALLPDARIDGSFLAWTLRGTAGETLNRLDEAGHGTKALRMEAWTSMELPLPPLAEQADIVAHIRTLTGAIDQLAVEAQSAITLLQERRAALISAAVTGKIDVRGLVDAPATAELS